MVTFKDSESKMTPAKRNIKLTGIQIKDDMFVDEEGNIAARLADMLPVDIFDMKITLELPDEQDMEVGEDD